MRLAVACAVLFSCATSVVAQGFTTLKGHGGPIMGVDVGPDGLIATASFDNSVGLWKDGEPTWLEGHDAAVVAVTFGPTGALGEQRVGMRTHLVKQPSGPEHAR